MMQEHFVCIFLNTKDDIFQFMIKLDRKNMLNKYGLHDKKYLPSGINNVTDYLPSCKNDI